MKISGGDNATPSPSRRPQGTRGIRFTTAIGGWFGGETRRPSESARSALPEGLCPECQSAIRELVARFVANGQDATPSHRDIVDVINRCRCLVRGKATSGLATAPAELRVKVVTTRPASGLRVTTVDSASARSAIGGDERPRAANIPQVGYRLPSGLDVRVIFPAEVCRALREHCKASNDNGREVGGMLVGFRHSEGVDEVSVIATDILPMDSLDSSGAHVRLDAEAWFRVGEEFETRLRPQGKERLGWYHTHPSQGIFFSKQDLDAHTVFTMPHQFALVVDPRRMDVGLFHWEDLASRRLSKEHLFTIKPAGEFDRDRSTREPETDCRRPRETYPLVAKAVAGRGRPAAEEGRVATTARAWIFLVVFAWLVAVFVAVLIAPSWLFFD